MSGGLFDPLGVDRPETDAGSRGGRSSRISAPAVAAGIMLAALAALVAVSWLRDTGDRGRPMAVGPIERLPPAAPAQQPSLQPAPQPAPQPATALPPGAAPASAAAPPTAPPPPAPAAPQQADQDVEIQNGVRIVRPRRGAALPGALQGAVPGTAPGAVPPSASPSGGRTIPVPDAGAQR